MVGGYGDGGGDREQEVGGEVVRRTPEEDRRATEEAGAMGPSIQTLDPSMAMAGSMVALEKPEAMGRRR